MQFFSTLFAVFMLNAAAMAASSDNVTVHVVSVGMNETLTFSPDSITAEPGEIVQFQFLSKNHSVVQSAFSSPCAPINTVMSNVTGFKSGFMPITNSVGVFSIMVNNTTPIWAYCSQVGHCAKGMVFAINAPTSGAKTFDAFKALAASSTNSTSSTSSGTGAGSSSSGTAASSTSSSTSTSVAAGDAARPLVNYTLLLLLGVFGIFYIIL